LNNLGLAENRAGNLSKAQSRLNQADALHKQWTGSDLQSELARATTFENLSNLEREQKRFDVSIDHAEKAVEIYKRWVSIRPGLIRPQLAGAYSSLALAYKASGSTAPALFNYQAALSAGAAVMATDSVSFAPQYAKILSNYSGALVQDNQWSAAEKISQRALVIREQMHAEKVESFTLSYATNLNNLAIIYNKLGKQQLSEEALTKANRILSPLYEGNPLAVGPVLSSITFSQGDAKFRADQFEAAEPYFAQTLRVLRELSQSNPDQYEPKLIDVLAESAFANEQLHKRDVALSRLDEATEIAEKRKDKSSLDRIQQFRKKFIGD
jgi:tetratricopeptide (TPR) repeat protein